MANRLPDIFLVACAMLKLHTASAVTLSGSVDDDGKPLADVVVIVEPLSGKTNAQIKLEPVSLALDQKSREFIPHILAIRTGTPVFFPNSDDIKHHVYSFSDAKRFEIKLYSGTPQQPIIFDQPGVVTLGCNIHDWMLGFIYVSDAEYMTQTDAKGRWHLELPQGNYRFSLWHPHASDTKITLPNLQVSTDVTLHHNMRLKLGRPSGKPPDTLQLQGYGDGF